MSRPAARRVEAVVLRLMVNINHVVVQLVDTLVKLSQSAGEVVIDGKKMKRGGRLWLAGFL